jgi:glycosyltransferase involved in cell wall biosynthesis
VADQDDHLAELGAELDELRRSLIQVRKELELRPDTPSRANALEAAHKHLHSAKTLARLLQNDASESRLRLERVEREAWDQKARRADATAKLKNREQLLEQIQRSAAWKIVKPIWKLFHRSRKGEPKVIGTDLAFALDLPKRWKTGRDIILIKGWCFSLSGKQIAGIRAKIGSKTKLARYGLERLDAAGSFPEAPAARQSGFTIELKVPVGVSTIRLEMIEHGSDWQPFLEQKLEREGTPGDETEPEDDSPEASEPAERILKLSALSASKAFELLQPAFQQHARRGLPETPLVSVLTPAYNSKPEWLAEAALSLLNQTFADWEWCIVDDGSDNRETKKLLEMLSRVSPRVHVTFASNAGISAATNQALDLARGEYVCFLDHDDLLHPFALEAMREKMGEAYDVIYSDEDKLDDATGNLVEPFFKPDWSPEYFRGVMYVGHVLCVRRELAKETQFDSAYDGVQDFEFMLRLSETGVSVGHIPRVLYHWRKTPGSIAEKTDAKPQIGELQERAVNAHLERVKLAARAEQSPLPHRLTLVPVKPDHFARVSIIIPTRDAPEVFGRCLKSVFEKTSYPDFEVIVMDNETADERSLLLMKEYPVRRIPFPDPFNFSRANNQGAAAATGEVLVFLNNDTEIITEDWLQHLVYYAEQPEVGAAGALLAYEDRTVQHAGVALGMRGTADHTMRRFPLDVDGYAGSLVCAREVSAVTGACLTIRKALFEEIGGFNQHFFTAYQDVDLCLRLRTRGLRVICTPRALLLHHESISRQSYYDMIDRMLLLDQWEDVIERGDPYYNPNLNLERGDYSRNPARA